MHYTKEDIQNTPRVKRLNLINSVTGVKPANLIGTISESGNSNLAIFSSLVHLGSNPALLGFIMRPRHEVRRDTFENIMYSNCFTVNQVHPEFVANAHYTSAKFEKEESEFEKCHLTEEYVNDFPAPFVKESRLKMGMKFEESIPIEINNCIMIVGSIQHLIVDDNAVDDNGQIDLQGLKSVGIGGLNRYYNLESIDKFPYARVNELPDFFNS
ncbi:MAG: flavin reductase [Flavobacteriales bacterium]|nr:flavin reductase [Flavobacteriales bacterium]MBL6872854.1 flavin reductase [Flavobacteriales bacterium]